MAGAGRANGYDLKTAVRVDQAYDFLMHFLGCILCLKNQLSCLPF
jgi:hypothetical protein